MKTSIFENTIQTVRRKIIICAVLSLLASTPLFTISLVHADTAPAAGTPATVSADPLPTAQIDGIVWAQVTVGNTVYATGHFSTARPAGVPLHGAGTVTRTNLMAYNITTGQIDTTFVHALNAGSDARDGGRAIAVSPDGKTLYVGGNFTGVDGQTHANIAAFDLTTNSLKTGFQGVNSSVLAVTATNKGVYFGGQFTQVGSAVRTRLASFNVSGGLTGWAPTANGQVEAIIVSPNGATVVIGGAFDQINRQNYYGMGAVTIASPGINVKWASQSASFPIRDYDTQHAGASITSFSENSNLIFLTAFNFLSATSPGGFEGRAAISPTDGHIVWMDDCHGDSYSAIPIGNVLYSVSHEHDCSAIGGFPEENPRINMHAEAETVTVDGKNVQSDEKYWNNAGQPRSTQLDWYPLLNTANVSGANQAAWSVTGNNSYVALGGEFTTANNTPQQGLVRYAIARIAPNKIGPAAYVGYGVIASAANSAGKATVTMATTSDRDNGRLTYRLYRDNGTQPIDMFSVDTRFWNKPSQSFTDSGLAAGSNHTYLLVASDPFGNAVTTTSVIDDTNPAITYSGSGWVRRAKLNRGDIGNDITYNGTVGASASYSFNGTSITFFSETANKYRGNVDIYIDGTKVSTVSTASNSATIVGDQAVYNNNSLRPGNHTIKVVQAQASTYLVVDGFRSGNTGVYDDTSQLISYAGGTWVTQAKLNRGDVNNDITYNSTVGSSASFSFAGTGITFLSETANLRRGNVDIYIDGTKMTTVTAASSNAAIVGSQAIYTNNNLTPGNHTIKVVQAQGGTYLVVDGFAVQSDGTTDDGSPLVQYVGANWHNVASNRGFGTFANDIHYSNAIGDYATTTFTGTGITFLTETAGDRGQIAVYIDGNLDRTVNAQTLNAPVLGSQAIYNKTGLSNGMHTIKVVQISGKYMAVDAFLVNH